MRFCKNCGSELNTEWSFCPFCGEKKAPEFCPGCGKKLEEDWAFCPFCGEDMNGENEK